MSRKGLHGPRRVAAALVALVAAACSSAGSRSSSDRDPSSGPPAALRIATLSGPADYVTGGDAVVGVDSPADRTLDGVTVTLDGADVTSRFSPDTSPHRAPNAPDRLVGLLTDLPQGTSELVATNGDDRATLAITGFASPATCSFWTNTFVDTLDASEGCSPEIVSQVYDLAVRPRGVRCTWQDGNINILGTDPTTGYAARPLDNVGVQYGLEALEGGAISVDEFLDLNEHIGGYDLDGAWQPQRERASDDVTDRAYAAGMVTAGTATDTQGALGSAGSGGLADVPIIVLNPYTDTLGDIHDRQRAFAIRDRLRRPDGTDDPALSIWTIPTGTDLTTIARQLSGGAEDAGQPIVRILDQWLTAAEESSAGGTWAARLTAAKPDVAADRCVLPSGEIVTGSGIYADGTPCATAYPVHADPRRAAGSPLVDDTLACHLTAVDPGSYSVSFTDEQAQRLRQIFPEGVCDWSHAGRGQQPPAGTWQVFDQP